MTLPVAECKNVNPRRVSRLAGKCFIEGRLVELGRTQKSKLTHVDSNPQRPDVEHRNYGIVPASFDLSVRFRTALVLTPTSAPFADDDLLTMQRRPFPQEALKQNSLAHIGTRAS